MKNIYAVTIRDRNYIENIFETLMLYISKDRQARIKSFYRKEDSYRALLADVLIRTIIFRDLGINNSDIIFHTNEYGKPILSNEKGFHFNISHSMEWVVCTTSDRPIGIDIEYIQPIDFDIAKRFFSMDEYEDLMKVCINRRLSYFYDLWTLKESYIKAIGKGLSIPLHSFYCKVGDDGIIRTDENMDGWIFSQYNVDSNYKLSVCESKEGEQRTKDINVIGISELCDTFMSGFKENVSPSLR